MDMGCYPAKFKGYYLTAYGLAVKHGYIGTEEEWLASLEAGDIEMKYEDGVLSYKTTKETEWRELPEFGKVTADLEAAAQAAEEAADRANTVTEEANTTLGQVQDSLFQANGQIADLEEKNENLSLWETYDPLKTYQPLNKVSYNGSSYVCILESTGNLPTDGVHWLMIAGKGEKGDPGEKGDTGTGLDIKGTYETLAELRQGVTAPKQGDLYNVGLSAPYTIYMWNETTPPGDWISQGQIQGPSGKDARKTVRFVVGTSTSGWTEDDCDYLCDGADDQMEIQAAIAALPESGGEIKILDGSYSINDEVRIEKTGVVLSGCENSTVLIKAFPESAERKAIVGVYSDKCTIKGFVFSQEFSKYLQEDQSKIQLHVKCGDEQSVCVENCTFQNGMFGVYDVGGYLSVHNCVFLNCFSGVYGYKNTEIVGCKFTDCYSSCVSRQAKKVSGCIAKNSGGVAAEIFSDNVWTDFSLDPSVSTVVTGIRAGQCVNNLIDNFRTLNTEVLNILSGDYQTGGGIASGNIIKNCTKGIAPATSGYCKISGNDISNCEIGVNVTGDFVQCSENRISHCDIGIRCANAKRCLVLSNEVFRGDGLPGDYTESQYTILLETTRNQNNLIAYNSIMGKNYVDEGGTGNTFEGNKFE
jgi:parallel beta-helix repeat protein